MSEMETPNASEALASELAREFPQKSTGSKRPFVVAAIVVLVLLAFGVRRLRSKNETSLGGGVNEISV